MICDADLGATHFEMAVQYGKELTFQKFCNAMDTVDRLPELTKLVALTVSVEQAHRPIVVSNNFVRHLLFTPDGLDLYEGLLSYYTYRLPQLESIEFNCVRFGIAHSPNVGFVEALLGPSVSEVTCLVPSISHRFFPELQTLCVRRNVRLIFLSPEKRQQIVPRL